jgi:Mg2+ and Co2+ transporter CorA
VDVNHPKVEFPVIGPKATVYFRDIYDNLYRIVDASYQYHDMIQGLLDAYLSIVNNRGLMVSVSAGLLWWFRRKQWI